MPGAMMEHHDERLKTLVSAKCGDCERYSARGTGRAAFDHDRWFVEYRCDHCGELTRSWRAEVHAQVSAWLADVTPGRV